MPRQQASRQRRDFAVARFEREVVGVEQMDLRVQMDFRVRQIASASVASGKLVVLLRGRAPPPIPVHFVLPPARTETTKVSAFLAFAVPELRKRLAEAGHDMGEARP